MLFMMYNLYSKSKKPDKEFKKMIDKEMQIAKKIGIKTMTVESNFSDFRVGDYMDVWNSKNYKYLVDSAHKNGIKVFLYTIIGEVAKHSKVYQKYHKKWAIRGPLNLRYSGFNSIMLQGIAYEKDDEFATFVFCPGSNWKKYFLKQIFEVVDKYDLDGIYIDRLSYRINCRDKRHGDKNHFKEEVLKIVEEVSKGLKKRKKEFMAVDLFGKPSVRFPDKIVEKYLDLADYILIEIVPGPGIDMENNPLQKFYAYFAAKAIWKSRKLIKIITKRLVPNLYNSLSISKDPKRVENIINCLKSYGQTKIVTFSVDFTNKEIFDSVSKVAKKTKTGLCFVSGRKKLSEMIMDK